MREVSLLFLYIGQEGASSSLQHNVYSVKKRKKEKKDLFSEYFDTKELGNGSFSIRPAFFKVQIKAFPCSALRIPGANTADVWRSKSQSRRPTRRALFAFKFSPPGTPELPINLTGKIQDAKLMQFPLYIFGRLQVVW